MRYLIDGHNLIPKLPGLNLRAIDDEMQLIKLLQEYCRRTRDRVDVYFDNAPLGNAGVRKFGLVTAHFVPQSRIADDAIRDRLLRLGRDARNWTVVSSDQHVQANARATHARVLSSDQFAEQLQEKPASPAGEEKPAEVSLDETEVDAWLELFTGHSQKPKKKK